MANSCSNDMKRALQLLFNASITGNVLFNQFAFIGDNFLLGTSLETPADNWLSIENDNITSPNGSFISFELCNLIKVYGDVLQYPVPTNSTDPSQSSNYVLSNFHIEHASLDNIQAIAFNFTGYNTSFKTALTNLITISQQSCPCNGITTAIAPPPPQGPACKDSVYSILNKFINITAGSLALYNAEVLGKIGDVLCIANSAANVNRIYFVCQKAINFIGFPGIN